jgi:dipeptidase D
MQSENKITDPNMQIASVDVTATATPKPVLPRSVQDRLLASIAGVISGIDRMSPSIPGLVQTSNNLARVEVQDGSIAVLCLARSSVDSERVALSQSLCCVLGQLGGTTEVSGEYPGWQPEPKSNIVQLMQRLYQEQFDHPPHVAACHAGLECGIIGSKFPGMEMISFGPNITGAHSPDEKVQISSVQKFYGFFLRTLASL